MFSRFKQSIRTSTTALLTNKVRSFLTMLGIIIGVGAVIVIMAVGAGAQGLILNQVKGLGSNLIGVLPGKAEEDGPPASVYGIVITTLTYDDVLVLRNGRSVPSVTALAAFVRGIGTASWGSAKYDTNLTGTTGNYIEVEGGELENGRFISEEEETNLAKVAVLGSAVKKELFGESEAVGQRIKIKKHSFEVIGVMKERGTVAFQDYDDQIFLPLKTAQKLILGIDYISMIRAKVNSEENIEQAIHDTEITLRERHNIADQTGANDDFTVRSMAQALDMITAITDALRYFLAAMAAMSLLVGGIGIMNIMLVSVTERTREIGLRKAIGANNFNIMSQFLIEAVIVTLTGGIIGIIGGALASYLISVVINFLGYDWDLILSPFSIILAVVVASAVGLVFGIYPARKASRLEPVEALRYE
jgi:putative ABC transport system permease protein